MSAFIKWLDREIREQNVIINSFSLVENSPDSFVTRLTLLSSLNCLIYLKLFHCLILDYRRVYVTSGDQRRAVGCLNHWNLKQEVSYWHFIDVPSYHGEILDPALILRTLDSCLSQYWHQVPYSLVITKQFWSINLLLKSPYWHALLKYWDLIQDWQSCLFCISNLSQVDPH